MKFSKSGYEVQTADSTESGLKIIRDGYIPDIMLVDIVMGPGDRRSGDGFNSSKKEKAGSGRRHHHAHQPGLVRRRSSFQETQLSTVT